MSEGCRALRKQHLAAKSSGHVSENSIFCRLNEEENEEAKAGASLT
jgi:hypothetical protein